MATNSTGSKTPLATAGIALITIGVGLIGYAWTQPNLYVKIILLAIGVVFVVFAGIAFIKVPSSDTSTLAGDIEKIQKIEAELAPFLQKYGGDIEAAIEAAVQAEFSKLDEKYNATQHTIEQLTDELNTLKSQIK